MTSGERWAADELDGLRAGRFRPGVWARFLRASFARAADTRRARPELARQARIWSTVGLASALAASKTAPHVRLAAPRAGRFALWWLAAAAMLYWVSHHVQFHYIRFANRTLLWINVVFFLLIVLVPFTTQLIGLYWYKPTMALLYGGQLILIALVIALHWWYGTRSHQLTGTSIDRHLVRSGLRRILVAPAICLIAIALCWFNPLISIICYACIPVYYVLPGHLDEHWWPFHHQHRQEGETR